MEIFSAFFQLHLACLFKQMTTTGKRCLQRGQFDTSGILYSEGLLFPSNFQIPFQLEMGDVKPASIS